MLFFFVVGCRQKRMKMWFGNQMQTTAVLLGGLHRKHVCAGDTADQWPHPTHHPLGIFRIHKQANGKRFLSLFFFPEGRFIVSLLSFCSWWVGFTSELESSSGLGGGGNSRKRFNRQRMGNLCWAFASSSWGFKLFVDLNLRFSCPYGRGFVFSVFTPPPALWVQ